MTAALALTLLLAALHLAGFRVHGTSSATAAELAGSCNNVASGFCNEFTGSSYQAASVQRTCEGQKMLYLAGACPTEKRVGTCLVYQGKNTESFYRYYANFPGVTVSGGAEAAAESQCKKLKGEWQSH